MPTKKAYRFGPARQRPVHPTTYPTDVKPWLAEALSNERWFGEAGFTWKKSETAEIAQARRRAVVRFLKKHSRNESLAPSLAPILARIGSCAPNERCLSGACPECGRALQRYFVHQGKEHVQFPHRERHGGFFASLVVELFSADDLTDCSLKELQKDLKCKLRDAGLDFAMGGIDLSYNTSRDEQVFAHWCVHFWFFTNNRDWEEPIRAAYSQPHVSRPLMIKSFDGNLAGLAYALKTTFVRRVSFLHIDQDRELQYRNTSDQPLRISERLQLYPFLDQQGLAARVFLMGLRPTKTDDGIKLVRLKSFGSVKCPDS